MQQINPWQINTRTTPERQNTTMQPTPAEKNSDQTAKSWQVFTKKPYLCRSCSKPYMNSPFNLRINYMSSPTRTMNPAGKLGMSSKLTWKKQVRNLPRQKDSTTANGCEKEASDPTGDPATLLATHQRIQDEATDGPTSPTDSPINESQCQTHQRPSKTSNKLTQKEASIAVNKA
mmetsp:Transcript_42033/g.101286  ORF Transcript_42033/g.101286 Transcript_42033/m.101286 type:complete len:175 (-) Transcript_42033:738-1262(-)